jgi:hypothetical protein
MKVKITFEKGALLKQGEDFIEIECDPHQSPKLPAFVMVFKDGKEQAHKGYYLVVTDAGSAKLEFHG